MHRNEDSFPEAERGGLEVAFEKRDGIAMSLAAGASALKSNPPWGGVGFDREYVGRRVVRELLDGVAEAIRQHVEPLAEECREVEATAVPRRRRSGCEAPHRRDAKRRAALGSYSLARE